MCVDKGMQCELKAAYICEFVESFWLAV